MADSPNVNFQKDQKTLTTKTTVYTICDFKKVDVRGPHPHYSSALI